MNTEVDDSNNHKTLSRYSQLTYFIKENTIIIVAFAFAMFVVSCFSNSFFNINNPKALQASPILAKPMLLFTIIACLSFGSRCWNNLIHICHEK